MTREELQKLTPAQLQAYFFEQAGYQPDAPANCAYVIRTGSRALTSHDTMDLRQKFEKWVKA